MQSIKAPPMDATAIPTPHELNINRYSAGSILLWAKTLESVDVVVVVVAGALVVATVADAAVVEDVPDADVVDSV